MHRHTVHGTVPHDRHCGIPSVAARHTRSSYHELWIVPVRTWQVLSWHMGVDAVDESLGRSAGVHCRSNEKHSHVCERVYQCTLGTEQDASAEGSSFTAGVSVDVGIGGPVRHGRVLGRDSVGWRSMGVARGVGAVDNIAHHHVCGCTEDVLAG